MKKIETDTTNTATAQALTTPTGSPLAWSCEIVSAIMCCDTAWAQQWGNGPEWPIDHIETEVGFLTCDINGPLQIFHMSDIARIRIVGGSKDGKVFENEEFYLENGELTRGADDNQPKGNNYE
jgi:hypothetical protein